MVDRLTAEPAAGGPAGRGGGDRVPGGRRHRGRAARRLGPAGCASPSFPPAATATRPAASVTPALFSFNNPRGACAKCNGFGAVLEYDESLIVCRPRPQPRRRRHRSLDQAALRVAPPDPARLRPHARRRPAQALAQAQGGPPPRAAVRTQGALRRDLPLPQGTRGEALQAVHPGVPPAVSARQDLRDVRRQPPQPRRAGGADRRGHHRGRSRRARWTGSTSWLASARRSRPASARSPQLILEQLDARLGFLRDVGLGYLTLDRQTRTLSGGEAQRIALANALGSRLVDTLYVLDEPSIGLHPRDTDRLLGAAAPAARCGQHRLVVEHDLAAIRQADFMLELGPGSGERGGRVVHAGPVRGRESVAHRAVPHRAEADRRSQRPPARPGPHWLRIRGATLHNLSGVDVDIPLGTLTAVTGVSGSGKSTLLHDVVYRNLEARLQASTPPRATSASRSGRSPRSPGGSSSRTCCWWTSRRSAARPGRIRSPTSRRSTRSASCSRPSRSPGSGSTPSATFSFNLPGGRCEACEGAGHVQVEMVFLADVFVPCEACGGTRYRREVLDVRIQGNSIHDVLQWTVDEAIARFRHQPKLGAALWQLQQVGLGYLRLGQPATTLSGGEAQRLKIARELAQAGKRDGRKLYILDEPTTGLHLDDVRVLIQVLDRLVGRGAHGGGHRAPPRRHQAGRLDHRSRPRGRRRRRAGGGAGHARGGRRGRRVPHRPLSAAAARPVQQPGAALRPASEHPRLRSACRAAPPRCTRCRRASRSVVPLPHHEPDGVPAAEPRVGEVAPGGSRSPARAAGRLSVDPARRRVSPAGR